MIDIKVIKDETGNLKSESLQDAIIKSLSLISFFHSLIDIQSVQDAQDVHSI